MWRSVRRLGVPVHAVDDAVQEIFLVVHRRLPEFEERTTIVAWLYAIAIRVVRQHRRTVQRKSPHALDGAPFDAEKLVDGRSPSPHDLAERQQAIRRLYAVLDQMNDERREVFVLYELEQLTAPEIAEALGVNVNTVYWRQRTARQEFEKILRRPQKSEAGSTR